MNSASFASFTSVDCVINDSEVPKSVQRSMISVFSPMALLIGATIVWGFITCFGSMQKRLGRQNSTNRNSLLENVVITTFVILFQTYPSVSRALLSILDCKDVDHDSAEYAMAVGNYWLIDTELQCFEGKHWILTAIFFSYGLGFVVGVPLALFIFLFLFNSRGRLYTKYFDRVYGFLYRAYNQEHYFWELVILMRKLFVALITVYGDKLAVHRQNMLILGVLVISLFSQVLSKPFAEPTLNRLEVASLSVSIATFFLGSFLSGEAPSWWKILCSTIVVATNVLLILWFIGEMIKNKVMSWFGKTSAEVSVL